MTSVTCNYCNKSMTRKQEKMTLWQSIARHDKTDHVSDVCMKFSPAAVRYIAESIVHKLLDG